MNESGTVFGCRAQKEELYMTNADCSGCFPAATSPEEGNFHDG
jgi:hypothetical protein